MFEVCCSRLIRLHGQWDASLFAPRAKTQAVAKALSTDYAEEAKGKAQRAKGKKNTVEILQGVSIMLSDRLAALPFALCSQPVQCNLRNLRISVSRVLQEALKSTLPVLALFVSNLHNESAIHERRPGALIFLQ
jgi:hypothetical protein